MSLFVIIMVKIYDEGEKVKEKTRYRNHSWVERRHSLRQQNKSDIKSHRPHGKTYQLVSQLEKHPLTRLLALLSVIGAVIAFTIDITDRKEDRVIAAWNLLNTQGSGNTGKNHALETLISYNEPIIGLDYKCFINENEQILIPYAGRNCENPIIIENLIVHKKTAWAKIVSKHNRKRINTVSESHLGGTIISRFDINGLAFYKNNFDLVRVRYGTFINSEFVNNSFRFGLWDSENFNCRMFGNKHELMVYNASFINCAIEFDTYIRTYFENVDFQQANIKKTVFFQSDLSLVNFQNVQFDKKSDNLVNKIERTDYDIEGIEAPILNNDKIEKRLALKGGRIDYTKFISSDISRADFTGSTGLNENAFINSYYQSGLPPIGLSDIQLASLDECPNRKIDTLVSNGTNTLYRGNCQFEYLTDQEVDNIIKSKAKYRISTNN